LDLRVDLLIRKGLSKGRKEVRGKVFVKVAEKAENDWVELLVALGE